MTRARLMAANLFLMAARFLTREEASPSKTEEAEEDDLPMPAGHPVVVRSEKAEAMLIEGARRAPREKHEPEAPLAGSLQDRMNRRDL